MFLPFTLKCILLLTTTPSPLFAVHRYSPSSFFETASKVIVRKLWPEVKPSDIFSMFGVILYHVIWDRGMLDTLQFNQPGCFSTNELVAKVTSGESLTWQNINNVSCLQYQHHVCVEHYILSSKKVTFTFYIYIKNEYDKRYLTLWHWTYSSNLESPRSKLQNSETVDV